MKINMKYIFERIAKLLLLFLFISVFLAIIIRPTTHRINMSENVI